MEAGRPKPAFLSAKRYLRDPPWVAQIAQQHELWLHVDGAYGAAFALCEQGKQKLNGIEHSDSLVVDPHKGLFLPFGSGAALVKDGQKLRASHYYAASYMPDSVTDVEVSPADVSPELSRPFRALRLWLPLKLAGVAPFRAALEEKLAPGAILLRENAKRRRVRAGAIS